jgi:1,2-diacylglycerol 3-alpha-glucosyltransferase
MVLTEAMAAGRPVIAVDAPGVREVVRSGHNGFLLDSPSLEAFTLCIAQLAATPRIRIRRLQRHARETAEGFSMDRSVRQLTTVYEGLLQSRRREARDETTWTETIEAIKAEWDIIKNVAEAAAHAFV